MRDGCGIYGDFEEMEELVKGIKTGEDALKRASVRSVNRTATSCTTFISKKIREDYKVKAKDVRKSLKIIKANFSRIEATIVGSGKPGIPIYNFYPTPRRVPSTLHKKGVWNTRTIVVNGRLVTKQVMNEGSDKYGPKSGIKVMIRKGRRKRIHGAFIQQLSSGHIGVFQRIKGAPKSRTGRTKIKELFGPSPVRLMESDHIQIPLDDFAEETLTKNMSHEAEVYLRREGLL